MKTLGLFLAASLFCVLSLHAASVKVVSGDDGKERVVLENNFLRLQVDPQRGARVDGFQFKPWGPIEIMRDKAMHGLLVDHFWQEFWPGQFWEAKYDHQILANDPAEIVVKFSYLSQDKGIPQVAGIRLEKTIALREDDRTVRATIRLTNTASEGKYVGYWMQNIGWLGGDKEGDQYFRPSRRGLSETSSDDANPPDAGFVREPQAGWTAAIDRKTGTGLVWLMDYHQLWFLYNCTGASTVEWQDDAVAIPPGKSWETQVVIVPVAKLKSVSYASRRLMMGAAFKEDPSAGRLEVTQTYLATGAPLKSVEVQTGLETLLNHRKETHTSSLVNLGFEPQTLTVSLPYDTGKREPAVIRLAFKGQSASGKAFTENAELWYRGSRVSNDDPNATDGSPFYTIPSPKKIRTLIKPDRIARIVKTPPQVLFLKGFLSPFYRFEAALKRANPAAQIKEGFAYNGGVFGAQLDFFPYDYDTLMSYDLVILGDVSAANLGETALEMLKDYCEHGGNLLVLGGPFAYGDGGYVATVLNAMLPVAIQKPFDLRAVEPGAKVACVRDHIPAEAGRSLRPEYIHEVKAKADADVLMTCGAWPMIVVGKCGSGRVGCITAPPLGKSNYCDAPQWSEVFAGVLKDLGVNR